MDPPSEKLTPVSQYKELKAYLRMKGDRENLAAKKVKTQAEINTMEFLKTEMTNLALEVNKENLIVVTRVEELEALCLLKKRKAPDNQHISRWCGSVVLGTADEGLQKLAGTMGIPVVTIPAVSDHEDEVFDED